MENQSPKHRMAALLVKWRHVLFAVMALLAAAGALMIPRTRINADVTSNLPDDSQMRKGLSILEKDFPLMDIRMQTLRVMFWNEAPADSLREAIEAIPGVTRWMGTERQDSLTLYQFILPREAQGADVVQAVQDRFGGRVVAEVDDNSYMPDNILVMLASGVGIALVILFLMCASFVEPLLILLTLGLAVAINMGTNALLPSVYLVTHTLSAVLQMVLSMDFAIILLNRYRQEKGPERTNEAAMTHALAGAAPSILSSGLTTIASMMMLVFMRLKIGGDLGVVLSKGVFCSLLATFTVLPALILRFDKAITRTEKPMLKVSTDGLARFEMRCRIPLAILFLVIFFGSWYLERKTTISYSMTWPTTITEKFPPKNTMLLLYRTADEADFMPIAERIAREEGVLSCLNYPVLARKLRTASEWEELAGLMPGLLDSLPEGALDLVYYAVTHPERKERMRMDELEPTAREVAALATLFLPDSVQAELSSRFDMDALSRKLMAQLMPDDEMMASGPQTIPEPIAEIVPEPAPEPAPEPVQIADTQVVAPPVADTVNQLPVPEDASGISVINYASVTQPRTAEEMAAFLQQDVKYVSLVYRMAKTGRKNQPATMNAQEFAHVLTDKVLGNRLYASMLTREQKEQVRAIRRELDQIVEAGPSEVAAVPEAAVDSVLAPAPADSLLLAEVPDVQPAADSVLTAFAAEEQAAVIQPEPEPEPLTPIAQLAEMALSGKRYTSAQLYRALRNAGVDVQREEIDLLYLYHGFVTQHDTTARLSLLELADWASSLARNPLVEEYLDADTRSQVEGLRGMLDTELGMLRGEDWSVAVIVSDLPVEGESTFALLDTIQAQCRDHLSGDNYYVGYSVMYKEMKEGFPRELLLLTLLTIGAIFLIVALTFRSLVVPFLLIPTVLSAVWLNVYASGLGGNSMLYIAYLIVQSILMGATIDYSILFTQYYRDARRTLDKGGALAIAYQRSFHAILTSGLILVLTPLLMTYTISDPMIISILRCISVGALAAILLIFLVLPATLVIMDRWVVRHPEGTKKR